MPTSYRPNRRGITALALGPEVRRMVVAIAEKGKAHAESIAPRETGQYAASFEVSEEAVSIDGLPRAAARLKNTAPYAAAVEFGTEATNGRGQRILGRTLLALSGRGRDSRGRFTGGI